MPAPTMPPAQVAHAVRMTNAFRTTPTASVADWVWRVITAGTPLPRHGRAALALIALHAEVALSSPNGYRGITAGGLGVLLDVSESTANRVLAELVKVGALDWSRLPDRTGRRQARIPQDAFDHMTVAAQAGAR